MRYNQGMVAADAVDWVALLLGVVGGLVLFLFGLQELTRALEASGRSGLRRVVHRVTRSRLRAALTGAVSTVVLQSSSLSTVLVVGFVSAGLVPLVQALAFILGANVGTTMTAQLVAFHVLDYGLAAAALGFLLRTLGRHRPGRHEAMALVGSALFGLGVLFHGLDLMSTATSPLRGSPDFAAFLQSVSSPWAGLLAGALFTAVVQSSSATTGLVIVLASQGLVSLELGIALILGANVGTCATALFASLGASTDGRRAAFAHVLFNAAGALLVTGFTPEIAGWLREAAVWLGASSPESIDTARWIAHAHTLFNLGNLVLFLPLLGPISALLRRLVRERPAPARAARTPIYLDPSLVRSPELALAAVARELPRLGELAALATERGLLAATAGNRSELDGVLELEADLDALHADVVAYLGRVAATSSGVKDTRRVAELLEIANAIESVGDTLERHVVPLGYERIREGVTISAHTLELVQPLARDVALAFRGALGALETGDAARARSVRAMKSSFRERSAAVRQHLAQRLAADAPQRVATFRIESELLEQMRRIFDLSRRLAQLVLARVEPEVPSRDPGPQGAA